MFDILLRNQYLDKEDALKSRTVSKTWKQAVDDHYRTANIHSATFDFKSCYRYPRPVIYVPVMEGFSRRVNLLANHGGNPFVGNRLLLKCGRNRGTMLPFRSEENLIQSEQVAHVWQHVHHLEICEDQEEEGESNSDDDDENAGGIGHWRQKIAVLLRPFLEMMPNVKTVLVNLDCVAADYFLTALPALNLLEQLVVSTDKDYDETNYIKLLGICQSSIKLLSGTENLPYIIAVGKLEFEKLEEFGIKGDEFGIELLGDRIDKVFPTLKVLSLECFGRECFYEEFVSLTHVFHTLEHIVVRCLTCDYKSDYVHDPTAKRVRKGLKNMSIVKVKNGGMIFAEFEEIVNKLRGMFQNDDKCKISIWKEVNDGYGWWWW